MLPHVRVISLQGSDRRPAMARQLDPLGLDWSFFDACTAPPAGLPYAPERARRHHGRELSPGELGCFASHVELWRWLAEQGDDRPLLVLEDDLIIDPVFFSRMEAVTAAFAPYDYLRLYAKVPAGMRRVGSFLDRHVAQFSGRAYGTQAYLISPSGAKRFLESIKDVVRPVDDEIDRFWAHKLPTLMIFPAPVIEIDRGSTIENSRRHATKLPRIEDIHWKSVRLFEKIRRVTANYIR